MTHTNLKKFNNSWYKLGMTSVIRALWYLTNLLFFRSGIIPTSAPLIALLRLFGATIGKDVVIKPHTNIKYPWKLSIGDHSWIGEKVWIDNLGTVTIGNHVCISQGALLLCGNHDYKKDSFDLLVGNIIIQNGAWIGAKSIVCPDVICGEESVLSVGSVASANLEPNTIYRGNPASSIRKRHKN